MMPISEDQLDPGPAVFPIPVGLGLAGRRDVGWFGVFAQLGAALERRACETGFFGGGGEFDVG